MTLHLLQSTDACGAVFDIKISSKTGGSYKACPQQLTKLDFSTPGDYKKPLSFINIRGDSVEI